MYLYSQNVGCNNNAVIEHNGQYHGFWIKKEKVKSSLIIY